MNMYLDDIRNPKTSNNWFVVRSFKDAIFYMNKNGCPSYISFDHDLGKNEKTGFDLTKWIIEKDLNMNGKFIPQNFNFNVHSANPIGKINIEGLLNQYIKQKG